MSLTMVRGSLGVTSGSITRLTAAVVLVHRQMLTVLGMKKEKEKNRRFSMILDTKAKTGNRAIILWFVLVKMISSSSSSSSSSFLPERCSFEMV